jgi:ferric iron reductase protein FhuF
MWITTSKISVFLDYHYYENQSVKKNEKNTESMFVLSYFHILITYGVSTCGILAKILNSLTWLNLT